MAVVIAGTVSKAIKPPEERFIGDDKLLRFVKMIAFPAHKGGLKVGEVFKKDATIGGVLEEGKQIGGLKIDHVDPKFILHFGSVVTGKLPHADMPVWEVARKDAKHRPISIAICGDSSGLSEAPETALARFYQTIEGIVEYSKEKETLNLTLGLPNILHARSMVDDTLHAILWSVNRLYGGGSISIYARPISWFAACQIKSLVFGGTVPASVEAATTPAVEPAIA